MKIISLTSENIKKLVAVHITPNGAIVTIAGNNGQGKTTVLDSIWWALAGSSHIQAEPIRKGQNKARIRLDLGEIIVERRFRKTEGGKTVSELSVDSADGARFPSPQKMLDDLIGALAFDPLAFARMEPRKQFDELRRISNLEIDIDKLDGQNKADYSRRTDVNRDAKAKRAQASAIVIASDLPEAPLDETALVDQMEKAGAHNTLIEVRKARRETVQVAANSKKADGARLRERAAALRKDAEQLDVEASAALQEAATLEKQIDGAEALPVPINIADIRVRLEHAKQVNAKLAARDNRRRIEEEAVALEKQAQEFTAAMEAREATKAAAIKAAKMPIEGLGFGDGVVMFNGVPFDQASSAEQLKVGLAIAMAANPKLRVIRMQHGNDLDAESKKIVAEMAAAADYQIWIEQVDSSSKVGVIIEDGHVVSIDGEPVAAAEAAA